MEIKAQLSLLDAELRSMRDGYLDPVTRAYWNIIDKTLPLLLEKWSSNGDVVLDVGCGNASFLIQLSKIGRRGYGMDPLWSTSLMNAQKRIDSEYVPVSLLCGRGESLPFRDHQFDMAMCLSTLQHVDDQKAVLDQIKRVLKEDGHLVVSVPQTILRSARIKANTYTMHFTLNSLCSMVEECGFRVVEVHGYGFFPPFSRKILNALHTVAGDDLTSHIVRALNQIAIRIPHLASSVIIVAQPLHASFPEKTE